MYKKLQRVVPAALLIAAIALAYRDPLRAEIPETWVASSSLAEDELVKSAQRSTMDELAVRTMTADQVLDF